MSDPKGPEAENPSPQRSTTFDRPFRKDEDRTYCAFLKRFLQQGVKTKSVHVLASHKFEETAAKRIKIDIIARVFAFLRDAITRYSIFYLLKVLSSTFVMVSKASIDLTLPRSMALLASNEKLSLLFFSGESRDDG